MAHVGPSHDLNYAILLQEVAQLSHSRARTFLKEQGEAGQENTACPKLGRSNLQAVQLWWLCNSRYTDPPVIIISHLYCVDRISAGGAKSHGAKDPLSAEFGPKIALFLRRQAFSLLSVLQQHSSRYS